MPIAMFVRVYFEFLYSSYNQVEARFVYSHNVWGFFDIFWEAAQVLEMF